MSAQNDIHQLIKSKLLALQPPPKTKVTQHPISLLMDWRQHIPCLGVLLLPSDLTSGQDQMGFLKQELLEILQASVKSYPLRPLHLSASLLQSPSVDSLHDWHSCLWDCHSLLALVGTGRFPPTVPTDEQGPPLHAEAIESPWWKRPDLLTWPSHPLMGHLWICVRKLKELPSSSIWKWMSIEGKAWFCFSYISHYYKDVKTCLFLEL